MAENKKYYWLKLKRDFFKRHDIRIIEEMPNGKDYILFYLKLLLESIDHEGSLRFSDTIPYNEQMLSVVTNTNIDIVRSAMKLFIELNMMQVLEDQTIYMSEVDKLIGSAVDNDNANRQRRFREKQKQVALLNVTNSVTKNNESKSIEKELENRDRDRVVEVEKEATTTATTKEESSEGNQLKLIGGTLGKNVVYLTDNQMANLIDKLGLDAFNRYVGRLADYIIDKNAHIKNHYDTILKWHEEDTNPNAPHHQRTTPKRDKSYDTGEFIQAALARSFDPLD